MSVIVYVVTDRYTNHMYRSVTLSSQRRRRVMSSPDTQPKAAQRIRETARELFYRQGIRAVGVEEIVKKAEANKPSLYRSFSSKDQLAASYLHDYEAAFWQRLESSIARHPDDARAGLLDFLQGVTRRVQASDYRGCGLTNCAVEYPERNHPARKVTEENKRRFRARLAELAQQMGASRPQTLGDALMLVIEGAYVTGQIFDDGGPATNVVEAATLLIDASLASKRNDRK